MVDRLRVGVVGCGVIAQVMHLPHLKELADRFEVVAVCDLSPHTVEAVGEAFGIDRRLRSVEDLLDESLDAVFVLTSGDHISAAAAAVAAGRHVFVEKPVCLRRADGLELVNAARRADVQVMTGYMKRHDPAFARLRDEVDRMEDIRLVTFATFESPEAPYLAHHSIFRTSHPEPEVEEQLNALRETSDLLVADSLGIHEPGLVRGYREMILSSMVHDLNLVRGALGEPDRLEYASVFEHGVIAVLRFGDSRAVLTWVALPGLARYRQEFTVLARERRAKLVFPSPYLRNLPTELVLEEGEPGTARSWESLETVSYEEAFKRELIEFHAAVKEKRDPVPSGLDGVRDVALAEAMVGSHLDGMPRDRPTRLSSEE